MVGGVKTILELKANKTESTASAAALKITADGFIVVWGYGVAEK